MCLKINWATHQWRYIYILHVCIMYTDLSSDISSKASELGPGRRGGVALALPHFFGKVIHFLLIIKICDKSSLHFASDASVHYNPELTPEWFDKNTRNKRFYINFIFCSTVSSCTCIWKHFSCIFVTLFYIHSCKYICT